MSAGRPRGRPPVRVPRPAVSPVLVRRSPGTARMWLLIGVAVCLFGVLAGRLVQLQLFQHDQLAAAAAAVSTRELSEPALRGRILAADGTPLAANAPTTVVTVDPRVLLEAEDEGRALLRSVAQALDLPEERLWGRTRVCGSPGAPPPPGCFSGSPYQPVPVAYDVDPREALAVLERPESFPGVAVRTLPVRDYPRAGEVNAAHVLGYLGRPTASEVAGRADLDPGDLVGRAGLEQVYDAELRGTPGRTVVAVDPRGVVTERREHRDPVPGLDVRTHLDPEIQAHVEGVLERAVAGAREEGRPADSAAAVVLDVRTGAVVAAASLPTYDPGIWTTGLTQRQYDDLTDPDLGEPLVSRVLSRTFPPASTFKAVSLPAALAAGVDPEGEYTCPGEVTIAGQRFTNFESAAYGEIDLQRVMEVSCDTTFYRWAHDAWLAAGGLAGEDLRDPFVLTAQDFGLGAPTGVDLPQEAPGRVPTRQWKRDYWESTREATCARAESGYPEVEDPERRAFLEQLAREGCTDGWQYRPGDAVNLSIGQGDVSVTPLQVAVVYAAIANGGTLWEPRVVAEVLGRDGRVVRSLEPQAAGQVPVDPESLEVVRRGLEGVNVRGTGAAAFAGFDLEAYPVAGKTGSAESFGRRSTAWYASYGPVPDPRYAVVVLVEQGGLGGEVAAPAAREVWELLRRR